MTSIPSRVTRALGTLALLVPGLASCSMLNVPEDLRGRVASAYRVLGFGAKAIGAALGGVVAAGLGIPALYAICAIATLATLVPFFRHVTETAFAGGGTRG